MTRTSVTAQGSMQASVAALEVQQVEKVFGNKNAITHALRGISLRINAGEFVSIMGASGSGKTTLLNCIATIEPVTRGRILLNGQDICKLKGRSLSAFRRDELGFIFQESNLVDTLTAYENIALALSIQGRPASEIDARVRIIAEKLDVNEALDKFPQQMSGGQRQRIAAARAIVCQPQLILTDEPTGSLDSRNARIMLDTLRLMNDDLHATIIMVTHDAYAASFTQRVIFIKDGQVFTSLECGTQKRKDFFARILEVQAYLGGDTDAD